MHIAAAAVLFAAGWNVQAAKAASAERDHVTACLGTMAGLPNTVGTSSTWETARTLSSRIFNQIGVALDWKVDSRLCSARGGIRIMIQGSTPVQQFPGALGYATPSGGDYIVIFYDRIDKSVPPENVPILLGHVMTHEITHVIEGVNRHSASGMMKAHWTEADLTQMARKPLLFTEEDVALIHAALDRLNAPRRSAASAKP